MRITYFFTRVLCLTAALALFAVPAARAAYNITIDQVGPDVVATGSGSLNLNSLSSLGNNEFLGTITPKKAAVVVGTTNGTLNNTTVYQTISGPASFGSGGPVVATSGSGAVVGVGGTGGDLIVPVNYSSGADLGTSTDTWSNQSLSSLGLIPGTYAYTLPNDNFTVNVVPEPASLGLLAIGGLTLLRRRLDH